MIFAQLLFFTAILIFLASLLRIGYTNGVRLAEKGLLSILSICGFALVLKPQLLDGLALIAGVERGRDLLFYTYIVISGWAIFRTHIRANKTSIQLSKLNSELAILRASKSQYLSQDFQP